MQIYCQKACYSLQVRRPVKSGINGLDKVARAQEQPFKIFHTHKESVHLLQSNTSHYLACHKKSALSKRKEGMKKWYNCAACNL